MFTDLELYTYLLDNEQDDSIGQPEAWLDLKSGRSIEITLESKDIIDISNWYFSIYYMCSEKEYDAYRSPFYTTNGIIDFYTTCSLGKYHQVKPDCICFEMADLSATNVAKEIRCILENFNEEIDW